MTTAVLATYYPPRRRLTVSYAGHPTGWIFRADTGAWADTHGIESLLNRDRRCEDLARRLLAALHGYAASDELAHDDVTFLLAEFVEGRLGPALWLVFKHRLFCLQRR